MAAEFPEQDEYPEVDTAFDEEAWEYLYLNFARIADAVALQAQRGKDPARIRKHIVRKYGENRKDIAIRIEAAARHLLSVKR